MSPVLQKYHDWTYIWKYYDQPVDDYLNEFLNAVSDTCTYGGRERVDIEVVTRNMVAKVRWELRRQKREAEEYPTYVEMRQ